MQNAALSQKNQFKALSFWCSISHCPWMRITIEVEERTVSILWFHFHYISTSINNKVKGQKISQEQKYSSLLSGQMWTRTSSAHVESTHILHSWSFISAHSIRHKIADKDVSLSISSADSILNVLSSINGQFILLFQSRFLLTAWLVTY